MKIVRVLSGGAAQGLVEALRPSFEATTGATIEGAFGAVGAMQARLLAGDPADVMILSRALIDGLARNGQVLALSAKNIGAVQTAIAVRSGDSRRRSAARPSCARRSSAPTPSISPIPSNRPPASISPRC
jgi:molybdate transport system substrate-binding protein